MANTVDTQGPTDEQGDFEIGLDGCITIGDGHEMGNKVVIAVKHGGDSKKTIRATVAVRHGITNPRALLAKPGTHITVTSNEASFSKLKKASPWNNKEDSGASTAGLVAWISKEHEFDPGNTFSVELKEFVANVPEGKAAIDVLIEKKNKDGNFESAGPQVDAPSTFEMEKSVDKGEEAKVHWFEVDPDFVLHGGQEDVTVSFLAIGFKACTLLRNNQEVSFQREGDGGHLEERPSITTVYRLLAEPKEGPVVKVERTVQVMSAGWNQLALPQGYPAWLFPHLEFEGSGERLYGIFVNKEGKAALWSSSTGVDDWRPEPVEEFPQHMAGSPGVADDEGLWLIGGSCYDPNKPCAEVWRYEKSQDRNEYLWVKKENLELPEVEFPKEKTKVRARMGHACVVFNKEIWVIGGFNNGYYFDDVLKLGTDRKEWQCVKRDERFARYMHSAVTYGDSSPDVWLYGGRGKDGVTLSDLWSAKKEGVEWKKREGPRPEPGDPLGTTLSVFQRHLDACPRLLLAGTFRERDATSDGNVTWSRIYNWSRNEMWEAREAGDAWERFEGGGFYMQAVSFNGFLFVWSLYAEIDPAHPPQLNIMIPS